MAQVWTKATLTQQLMGELNQDRNAAGGTVPDRLANIVQECHDELWEMADWKFRKRTDTLSFTEGDDAGELPEDFDKLDPKWVAENNANGRLRFTDDEQEFDNAVAAANGQAGRPRVAIIRPKTDGEGDGNGNAYAWQVVIAPAAEEAFTYPLVYFCTVPELEEDNGNGNGEQATPTRAPSFFHRLWHALALARGMRHFRRDDAWREQYAFFKHVFEQAVEQNNRTLSDAYPVASHDGYQDVAATMSNFLSRGGP